MAAFEYVALDQKGKQKKGIIEGDTPRQIRQILRDKHLIPLDVESVTSSKKQKATSGRSSFFQTKISASDLALITRQVATLVRAAIPVEETVKAVADQTEKAKQRSMLMGIRSRVVEGHTMADALSEYPGVFNDLYRSMVAAGEKSGHLDLVLERLADYTESRQEIQSKISGALVYPIILTVVSVGIVGFLLGYVVPQIVGSFTQSGQELPMITQILLSMSEFVKSYGIWVLVSAVALFSGFKMLLRKPKLRLAWDKWKLSAPIVGKVIRGMNAARFARTLAILNQSSVPLLEGMKIAGDVMTNAELKRAVKEAAVRVREGAGLKVSLQQCGYFPPMMLHMIGSGESSGELEQMLDRAAYNQEKQFDNMVSTMMNMIGPIMILIMGSFVFTIVLAIMLPVFKLSETLG
ncbi:type II secretion system protein GspF [Aliikangiella marina]|uniref:General secretion pathway protein F n=1 Tax=Aliikangiella marina TaxID=1712262 RepID=A0A545T9M3_9GAMM|nr:type II secretion system inner membrane protein GspF [Aliikangiella marina]TQV73920.1 type II secretion system protein GspF [Aliikangiella marina]